MFGIRFFRGEWLFQLLVYFSVISPSLSVLTASQFPVFIDTRVPRTFWFHFKSTIECSSWTSLLHRLVFLATHVTCTVMLLTSRYVTTSVWQLSAVVPERNQDWVRAAPVSPADSSSLAS